MIDYRKLAFKNYPHTCAMCDSKEKLQVHHKDKNRENNTLDNLVILCQKCHMRKVHDRVVHCDEEELDLFLEKLKELPRRLPQPPNRTNL